MMRLPLQQVIKRSNFALGSRSRLVGKFCASPQKTICPTLTTAVRAFSSARPQENVQDAIASIQKQTWNSYISSGRGSDLLFRAIDQSHSGNITSQEFRQFLDNVEHKGVHPRAFTMLDELAHDHAINKREFKSWLVLATKLGHEKNSSYSADYYSHPQTGERQQPKKKEDDSDEPFHSFNEVTMNQNVR